MAEEFADAAPTEGAALNPSPSALERLPLEEATRLHVLPLEVHGSRLSVAVSQEPSDALLDELAWISECRIRAVQAGSSAIREGLRRLRHLHLQTTAGVHLPPNPTAPSARAATNDGSPAALPPSPPSLPGAVGPAEAEEAPADGQAVAFIATLLADAHAAGASDIHIECTGVHAPVRIRFRRDGRLEPYLEAPPVLRSALVARIKVMAQLDTSERRRPQDGRIRQFLHGQPAAVELRVATIPTQNGLEDVVLRLQGQAQAYTLDSLSLHPLTRERLVRDLQRPHGLLLCAGPTGSGKTTTLHALLQHLNTPERKIWTAEDPVEITQEGLRQVQIDPRRDWTFERALRALLRADPDVLMVGEIRDRETLRTAIEAALTGHLVLSTLHTRSAADTVTRLLDLGLDPYQFADSLVGVMGQRLVRRCCSLCATHWGDRSVRTACPRCSGSGLWGRIPLHEWLSVDDTLRRLIQRRACTADLHHQAQERGMVDLRQDGLWKVQQGLTRIAEVEAVLGAEGCS